MMRLRDPGTHHGPDLSDDLEQKVTHETPTVQAPGTASYEGLEALSEEESKVVKMCKSCTESAPWDAEHCPKCGDELVSIRKAPDMYLHETVGGKYELTEKIGEGGMGVVYLAINESVGQKVAVKFLNKRFADDEGIVRRFINEAKSYIRVNHPNAVTLHDYGQHDDGALFIITEFVDGRNLTQTLQENGPLPADVALDVSIQIAEVLSAAHHEGIIHRDLKPDNVMLIPSPRGRYAVKVLDFGIAKIVDDEDGPNTETGSVFGTPEFMSPEQARGDEADPRSDIYALGVIMFYMLTGKLPFRGKNKLVVLNKQLNEAPPRPSKMVDDIDVPARLESVILKCLNKGRLERYDSADDLLEALEDLRIPGGQDTDKVGVTGYEATPPLGEIRRSTVRLGEATGEPDPHADTLAAPLGASHDEPNEMDLESIEMWREQGAEASSPQRGNHQPALVAIAALVVFAAVATIAYLSTDDEPTVDVEGAVMTAHADGMLSVADGMIAEGHLAAAKSALASTRDWESAGELASVARERREALIDRIARLEKSRAVFEAAVDDGECDEARALLDEIKTGSEGLARELGGTLNSCGAKGATEAPDRPEPEPKTRPEPTVEVEEPATPEPQPQETTPEPVEPAEEAPTVDEAIVPTEATPEPDPPRLGPDGDGTEQDGETPAQPEESTDPQSEDPDNENAAEEDVPDGMALPPRQIGE